MDTRESVGESQAKYQAKQVAITEARIQHARQDFEYWRAEYCKDGGALAAVAMRRAEETLLDLRGYMDRISGRGVVFIAPFMTVFQPGLERR